MLLFGCIISFLYIKPQLQQRTPLKLIVVLYRFSTSNHNFIRLFASNDLLYYIVSLHQTTTESVELYTRDGLYYIVSLHQTTTPSRLRCPHRGCIISFLYIKPQQCSIFSVVRRVVLYRFSTSNHNESVEIKYDKQLYYIVSLHQTTTCDKMNKQCRKLYYIVSLHQTTTGFLQPQFACALYYIVSLHQTTTAKALADERAKLYYIVSLHQTTTHN